MRVMIYIFIGDNLIGWANCIGNPESLLNALACGLIPRLGKYPALWRPSLHTHPHCCCHSSMLPLVSLLFTPVYDVKLRKWSENLVLFLLAEVNSHYTQLCIGSKQALMLLVYEGEQLLMGR